MTERPLRFCMVTTYYPPYHFGGDAVFVHRLANELARRGHRVDVIHCRDAYHLAARQPAEGPWDNHPNVRVHGLKSPFGFLSPLATQQTGRPWLKSARIERILATGFDVIHYHNVSLVGGPKLLEYGQAVKLYTPHEYWLVCPTHTLFRFNRAPCTRPHCFTCALTYKRPPQWWRYTGLLSAAVRHVDAFLAPSRFSQAIHQRLGLDARVVHLPLFAPSAEAHPDPLAPPGDEAPQRPYFLFVGRLERLKGLHTLIPVFRGYPQARLLIAGTGREEARLRRLAAGSVSIGFLGQVPDRRLQRLYRDAVAAIVPSLCYETFGQVVLEAFRQQTPVVTRNRGALPELVEESGGGFVYDTDAELVAALDTLLGDPSRRRALGSSGYEAFQRKWTADTHVERYLALIDEIAASRRDLAVAGVSG
jgi:glycosyltransferase involved in cell wall biosynthesis